ncbi:MAG: tetratricopeptide repeat protein [Pseudanabaenaceae cyanobacterium]|jgi:tetratricopeptide (TPR) repeat protein
MEPETTTESDLSHLSRTGEVAHQLPTLEDAVSDWESLWRAVIEHLTAYITANARFNGNEGNYGTPTLSYTPVTLGNVLERFECEVLYEQERLGTWTDCWQWRTGIFAQLLKLGRQADLVSIEASLNNNLVVVQLGVKQRRFGGLAPWLQQTRADLVDLSELFDNYPLMVSALTSPVLERNLLDAIQGLNPWQTRLPEVAELIAQCLALHQKAIAIAQTDIMPVGSAGVSQGFDLSVSPLFMQLVYNLGNIYAAIGERESARNHYEQVLQWYKSSGSKDSQSAKAWFSLGNLALNMSERHKAQQYFSEAIQDDPYLLRAHVNYAYTLEQAGDFGAAEAYLNQCIWEYGAAYGSDSNQFDSGTGSGLSSGTTARKQQILHRCVLSAAHHNLGRIYQQQGNVTQAITADEMAIMYQPTNLYAKFQLANSYRQSQKFFEAAAQYEAILQMDAYFVGAYLPLIDLYIIFGNSGINIYQKWCDLTEQYISICQEDFPDWVLSAQIKSLRANLMAGNAEIAAMKLGEIEGQLYQNQMEQINIPTPIWAELYAEFLFFVPFLRDDVAENGKLFDLIGQNYARYIAEPLVGNFAEGNSGGE